MASTGKKITQENYSSDWSERINNLRSIGTIDEIVSEIYQNPTLISEAITYIENPNPTIAWRTAWIIDKLSVKKTALIEPYHKTLVGILKKTGNNSIRRLLAKILAANPTKDCEDGELIDKCLNWIIQPKIPVAVKANVMQLLFEICRTYPELIHEFRMVVEEGLPTGSKGYKSKARNLLKAIDNW